MGLLLFNPETTFTQFIHKTNFICRFQQTWPICTMHFHRSTDDPFSDCVQLSRRLHYNDAHQVFFSANSAISAVNLTDRVYGASAGRESFPLHAPSRRSTRLHALCPCRSHCVERCRTCAGQDTT